jgi:hypothetical protein
LQVTSIAVGEGVFALTAAVHRGGMLTTDGAIATEPPFKPCSYLAVGTDAWPESSVNQAEPAETTDRPEKPELL